MYASDELDVNLAAVVLRSVAEAHPEINDPDIILDRATRVTSSLGHLVGSAEFCGGVDALLEVGSYEIRFIDPRTNPLVQREISPAPEQP